MALRRKDANRINRLFKERKDRSSMRLTPEACVETGKRSLAKGRQMQLSERAAKLKPFLS